MSEAPSWDEVQRVRREECRQDGHRFSVISAMQSLDPKQVICERCGGSWAIDTESPFTWNASEMTLSLKSPRWMTESTAVTMGRVFLDIHDEITDDISVRYRSADDEEQTVVVGPP
jgi:hypothetical protein